jgi:hypothetical protein
MNNGLEKISGPPASLYKTGDVVWKNTRVTNMSGWVASGSTISAQTNLAKALYTFSEIGYNFTEAKDSTFGTSTINSVEFGNGLWVAVGVGGQLRTSTDATTWVTQTSEFGTSAINSVAFGNGLWVAGGAAGQLRTSTDAITWVTQTSEFGTSAIQSVAFGGGLWVAGGNAGTLRTSTDAITWVTQTSQFGTSAINSVAFGNGLWVAGGAFGSIMSGSSPSITKSPINTVSNLNFFRTL